MASVLTRRDFLKCAGVAVLAVTASGIFTGCGGSGGGSGGLSGYGAGETVDINGVKVKLLGYEQYYTAEMAGNYAGQSMIQICFGIENQTDGAIDVGNSATNYLSKVLQAIYKNNFASLGKGDFVTATTSEKLDNAAIAYRTAATGTIDYGVISKLDPKETGCIKVFTVVPSKWEQIGIQYTPEFARDRTINFVLNSANKI